MEMETNQLEAGTTRGAAVARAVWVKPKLSRLSAGSAEANFGAGADELAEVAIS